MRASGQLTRLTLAWSRDANEKIYVQHRMREVGRDLWAWLNDGAHIYVCGDAQRMAKDVETALVDIVAEHGGCSPADAKALRRRTEGERPLSGGRVLRSEASGRDRRPHPIRNAARPHGAAGAAAGVPRARRQARGARRRQRRRGLEGGAVVGRRRARRRLCGRVSRTRWRRSPPIRRAAPITVHARAWTRGRSGRRRGGHRRLRRRRVRRRLRRGRARRRRAGQRHRQAGVLRFRLRRHRQPLAAGDRHLDRRRRAGVRAGDPRQARGAAAARLRRLGRGGAALARGGEGVRPVVRRPAQVLAAVHRACGDASRRRSRATPISSASSPK